MRFSTKGPADLRPATLLKASLRARELPRITLRARGPARLRSAPLVGVPRAALRSWARLALTRGGWGSPVGAGGVAFLKVSSCEGPHRQRLRLVPDGCGTRHLDAAKMTVRSGLKADIKPF